MTIERSPQFGQLPMFMTAREIQRDVVPGDFMPDFDRDEADLWSKKKFHADEKGLTAKIHEQGILKPVLILHEEDDPPVLSNGHHRVAVAADMGPDTIVPVHHMEWKRGRR